MAALKRQLGSKRWYRASFPTSAHLQESGGSDLRQAHKSRWSRHRFMLGISQQIITKNKSAQTQKNTRKHKRSLKRRGRGDPGKYRRKYRISGSLCRFVLCVPVGPFSDYLSGRGVVFGRCAPRSFRGGALAERLLLVMSWCTRSHCASSPRSKCVGFWSEGSKQEGLKLQGAQIGKMWARRAQNKPFWGPERAQFV